MTLARFLIVSLLAGLAAWQLIVLLSGAPGQGPLAWLGLASLLMCLVPLAALTPAPMASAPGEGRPE